MGRVMYVTRYIINTYVWMDLSVKQLSRAFEVEESEVQKH